MYSLFVHIVHNVPRPNMALHSYISETLLTLSQTSPGFYMSAVYKSFENTGGKGELLATSNFSFSHSVFYPFGELSAIFIKFEIFFCKLFQFGKV